MGYSSLMKKATFALSLALAAAPLFAATPAAKAPPVKDLVEASGRGDTAEIARLLKAGVPVNGRLADADNGMTALTVAATIGQVESVKALLAANPHGATPGTVLPTIEEALRLSAQRGAA